MWNFVLDKGDFQKLTKGKWMTKVEMKPPGEQTAGKSREGKIAGRRGFTRSPSPFRFAANGTDMAAVSTETEETPKQAKKETREFKEGY